MNTPQIAIIVLHYKNLDDTRACLKSLEGIGYPRYFVIVVNNDTPDHGKTLKDEFPDIQLIQNERNLGFAEGNNFGIRAALANDQTDAILILNNDIEVEPDFLAAMTNVKGDMIAPRMMQYDDRNKVDNLGVVMMKSGLPFNRTDEKQKLFCPSAGCALYSRKLLQRVILSGARRMPGGAEGSRDFNEDYFFDPLYFTYTEDVDLGFRARLLGFEPGYAKDAMVYHKGSASSGRLSDLAVYHTYRNLIWTQYKNYPLTLCLRNLFWIILGWKLIFWGYVFKRRPRVIAKALFDGVAGLSTMKQKRREIQKRRTADTRAIRSWFEQGLFPLKK